MIIWEVTGWEHLHFMQFWNKFYALIFSVLQIRFKKKYKKTQPFLLSPSYIKDK